MPTDPPMAVTQRLGLARARRDRTASLRSLFIGHRHLAAMFDGPLLYLVLGILAAMLGYLVVF